jgi:hypothetical protein
MTTKSDVLKEVEALELCTAAYHEAGHAVLVRRFGGIATPRIWRNESGRPGERAWVGECHIFTPPGEATFHPSSAAVAIVPVPVRWRVYVGLAGHLSEAIYRRQHSFYSDFCAARDHSLLSKSDIDLMRSDGQWPSPEDVSCTVSVLKELWDLVRNDAQRLIELHTALT